MAAGRAQAHVLLDQHRPALYLHLVRGSAHIHPPSDEWREGKSELQCIYLSLSRSDSFSLV